MSENYAERFWQDVEESLVERGYARSQAVTDISLFKRRMSEVSDLDLVYHDGVRNAVTAIHNRGFEMPPSQVPSIREWSRFRDIAASVVEDEQEVDGRR